MEILPLISLIMSFLVIVFVVLLLLRLYTRRSEDTAQGELLLQGQLDTLRNDIRQELNNTQTTLLLQLNNVTSQLQVNTGQVDSRLGTAVKVIQDVQNKLGELGKATQEIKELGQSVSKLEEMLKAPKLRGGLGELLLEDLLKQVLPVNAYNIQYTFRNGQTVDAIINTAGGKVPVDSKFPLENFRKMLDAKVEQEKKTAARLFKSDVKKHIDSISEKYILPDEGTFDFALMYIPAENIYYETIIKDESYDDEEGLYAYATKRRVVPVSPNSFYAHLRVIALGLKGLQIEKSAREIFQNLERLGSELHKFNELFETLGAQLNNAKNNYDKADKQLAGLTEKFKTVQSVPDAKSKNQLDAFPK
jgi:DNA recombination protein RmuC